MGEAESYVALSQNPTLATLSAIAPFTAMFLPELAAGFSFAEIGVIGEAQSILNSSEFAALQTAYANGQSLAVNIGGRAIQYEAGFTYANAMTLGEANGFVLGPSAFSSPLETASTVAQELFRLESGTLGYGEAGGYASEATAKAFAFAQRAGTYILGGP